MELHWGSWTSWRILRPEYISAHPSVWLRVADTEYTHARSVQQPQVILIHMLDLVHGIKSVL